MSETQRKIRPARPPEDFLAELGRMALAFAELEAALTVRLLRCQMHQDCRDSRNRPFKQKVILLQQQHRALPQVLALCDHMLELGQRRNDALHAVVVHYGDDKLAHCWNVQFNTIGFVHAEDLERLRIEAGMAAFGIACLEYDELNAPPDLVLCEDAIPQPSDVHD